MVIAEFYRYKSTLMTLRRCPDRKKLRILPIHSQIIDNVSVKSITSILKLPMQSQKTNNASVKPAPLTPPATDAKPNNSRCIGKTSTSHSASNHLLPLLQRLSRLLQPLVVVVVARLRPPIEQPVDRSNVCLNIRALILLRIPVHGN